MGHGGHKLRRLSVYQGECCGLSFAQFPPSLFNAGDREIGHTATSIGIVFQKYQRDPSTLTTGHNPQLPASLPPCLPAALPPCRPAALISERGSWGKTDGCSASLPLRNDAFNYKSYGEGFAEIPLRPQPHEKGLGRRQKAAPIATRCLTKSCLLAAIAASRLVQFGIEMSNKRLAASQRLAGYEVYLQVCASRRGTTLNILREGATEATAHISVSRTQRLGFADNFKRLGSLEPYPALQLLLRRRCYPASSTPSGAELRRKRRAKALKNVVFTPSLLSHDGSLGCTFAT
ncbi:hypothetical protein BKA56DRAFT_657038 [Ilyonectria sp. MPI-CAGE-AT-0026]|nr:hypothetical protein BKA56DRAFT_657038 [Ilyonectria sp. MPI-CAGE-AT-0026]